MAVQIGPKIGIDGEAEYRKQINGIITQAKTLSSEMRSVTSSFDESTSAQDKAAKKSDVLNKQIKNQEELIAALQSQLSEAAKKYGENDEKTLKWKQAVNNATTELNGMKKQLADTNAETKQAVDTMGSAEKASLSFADVLKANLLTDAIRGGFTLLKDAVSGLADTMKAAVSDSAAFADNILTLSTTTGLSTESLQEFYYMAELADTSVDTITGSLTKLTKSMYSAGTGSKSAEEAFAALGVQYKDTNGEFRGNEEVFYDTIEALSKVQNETERDALAMQLFGKSAKDLYPLMAQGKDGLAALREEAQQMGYVLGEEDLAKLGAVDDSFQRWNNTLDMVTRQIAVGVAPAVESFMTTIQNMVANIDWEAVGESLGNLFDKLVETLSTIDLSTVINGIVEAIVGFIDAIAQIDFPALFQGVSDVMNFIKDYGGIVAAAIAGIVAVVTAMQIAALATTPAVVALAGTLAPFIAPIAAVVAAVAGLIAIIKNWGAISEWLKETWNKAKETVIGIFTKLKDKVSETFGNMGNAIHEKVESIKNTVSGIFNTIKEIISGVVSNALSWGKDLVQGLIDGITSKIQKVKDTVSGIANTIAEWLHFSRPDVGPLRYYEQWMPDFMEGLAEGIERNKGLISDAMDDVTATMTISSPTMQIPARSAQNGLFAGNNAWNITINGGNASAEEIANEVMDRIQLEYERTAGAW